MSESHAHLALVYQNRTDSGEISHFSKLVSRESVDEEYEGVLEVAEELLDDDWSRIMAQKFTDQKRDVQV